jgi:hypothetical protein
MDIDVFIQGNADFRVTTGKSRRSIQARLVLVTRDSL